MRNWFKKEPEAPTMEELEIQRMLNKLQQVTPGTDAYERLLRELTLFQTFAGKRVEATQKFTKQARGDMMNKVVGAASIGAISFGLAWWEKHGGNMFSGSSSTVMKGLLGKLGDLIPFKGNQNKLLG